MASTLAKTSLVLSADHKGLDKGLNEAKQSIAGMGTQIGISGGGLAIMGGAAGKAAAAVKILADQAFSARENVKEWADKIRELEEVLTDSASRQQAIDLGILPEDFEDIKKMESEFATLEKGWESIWKKPRAELFAGIAAGTNDLIKGVREDLLGLPPLKVQDPAKQKEWMENQKKAKAEQEALKESVKSFGDELKKTSQTIGMTSEEVKVWELRQKKVNDAVLKGFEAQIKQNKALQDAQKLKEDVKAFGEELTKTAVAVGRTSEEVKLLELAQRGADASTLKMFDAIAKTNKELAAGFALIEENPFDKFAEQQAGLNQLLDSGRISWEAYQKGVAKASEQLSNVAQPKLELPKTLKKDSSESISFINTFRLQNQKDKELKELLVEQKKANEIARQQLAVQRQQLQKEEKFPDDF